MTRILALTTAVVCATALTARAQVSFDSNVCYVSYQVKINVDHTSTDQGRTTTWKYESVWDNTVKLDVRSPGQVLSMVTANIDPAKLQKMSPTEQLQYSQNMINAMQYTANWIPNAPEGVDGGDAMLAHLKAVSVPVRVTYTKTTTGDNLGDETGGHYDIWEQTTLTYAGNAYTSPEQAKFEMNTASKKHWLSLPFNFKDVENQGNVLKWVTVSKSRKHGAAAWDPAETHTDESILDAVGGSFRFDQIPAGQTTPIIEGTTDATGKVAGTQSYAGHMDRLGPNVPVTMTYHYVVTTTPPARAAGGK
ncbi:MAG TPA: hypothetical protein VJS69_02860 [Candidatus Krumholzibacteria bacterium]|nr:hypothetical protein [Candidatus Krumholzibacteria bacterium]